MIGRSLTVILAFTLIGIWNGTAMALDTGAHPQVPPDYDARLDPASPDFDPAYDASRDPDHPLKDPDNDPGADWGDWRMGRGDGTPAIRQAVADWDWGRLFFDRTYQTQLVVTNNCEATRTVSIFINDNPFLDLPRRVTVPGKSQREVPGTITMPPEPEILLTGQPGEAPPGGRLPPGAIIPNPFDPSLSDPEPWAEIGGNVVIWHPWGAHCHPRRDVYNISGGINFEPRSDDSDEGPQRIASAAPCHAYWSTGEPPPQLDEDCTEEMRTFARQHVEYALQWIATLDPDAWAWLPDAAAIGEMSIDELLAMKARADEQIATESGQD